MINAERVITVRHFFRPLSTTLLTLQLKINIFAESVIN